jgi:hypothetical protein
VILTLRAPKLTEKFVQFVAMDNWLDFWVKIILEFAHVQSMANGVVRFEGEWGTWREECVWAMLLYTASQKGSLLRAKMG